MSLYTILGVQTPCEIDSAVAMVAVGIPAVSNARAIRPIDWWHTGQTGTSNAISQCSSIARCTSAGANCSRTFRAE